VKDLEGFFYGKWFCDFALLDKTLYDEIEDAFREFTVLYHKVVGIVTAFKTILPR